MVRVLVIGDPHFKISNVMETEIMTEKILDIIKTRNIDLVVNLGDTLHHHEKIHVGPLCRAIKMMKSISELCPLFCIIGNHDRPNNSDFLSEDHPFVSLRYWKDTYIVDKVMTHQIQNKKFLFVPYVFPGRFDDAIKTELEDISDIQGYTAVFAHQEFRGAKMGAIVSKNGDIWPENRPLVISGHVHDYDRLQDNLIYVGTPMQHSFGETSRKTVSIFQFEDNTFQEGGDCNDRILKECNEERIDLGIPKKITYRLKYEDVDSFVLKDNCKTKLVIRATNPEIKKLKRCDKIKTLLEAGVLISYETILYDEKEIETGERKQNLSYKERLLQYIKKDKGQKREFIRLFK